jgi:hypothetical protein
VVNWLQRGQHIPSDFFIELADQEGNPLELISADVLLIGKSFRDCPGKVLIPILRLSNLRLPNRGARAAAGDAGDRISQQLVIAGRIGQLVPG